MRDFPPGGEVAVGEQKIAVAVGVHEGPPPPGRADLTLVRLNLDGSRDTSFGDGGIATPSYYDSEFPRDTVSEVAMQSDGHIVIGSSPPGGGIGDLIRLTEQGTLDSSFGGGDGVAEGVAGDLLASQPDGKIVAAGWGEITRLNSDGTPDLTFGDGDGVVRSGVIEGLALQQDGAIVVSHTVGGGCHGCLNMALKRYTPHGQPDPSFGGGDGFVMAHGASAGPVAIQGEKIVVQLVGFFGYQVWLARYTSEGELDPTFGGDGTVEMKPQEPSPEEQPVGIRLGSIGVQPSGRLLAVGEARPAGTFQNVVALMAFRSDGGLDQSIGRKGFVFTPRLVRCRQRFADWAGGPTSDVITDFFPFGSDAVIAGLGGDDEIDAIEGSDLVCAGHGDDRVHAGRGSDRVFAGPGADFVLGERGEDRLFGGPGADRLLGGVSFDFLFGGAGDDFLRGGDGPDFLRGGTGDDVERP